MKTRYIHDNDKISVINFADNSIKEKISPGVYSVEHNPILGYFLKINKPKFELPEKIYGDVDKRISRIMKTYDSKDTSLGVLLTGLKGSGKTLLIKKLANTFIEEKELPVILINSNYTDEQFLNFLNSLKECVIVFDEFAKNYSDSYYDEEGGQSKLLSLFDGVNSFKRLILLSENKLHKINEFYLNRPGRIYYHFTYEELSTDVIRDYCEDLNVPESMIQKIIQVSPLIEMNFDILQTIVEDYLIHKEENIHEMLKILNIRYRNSLINFELAKVLINDKEIEYKLKQKSIPDFITEDDSIWVSSLIECEEDISNRDGRFDKKHIIERKGDILILRNAEITIHLKRIVPNFMNYNTIL